MERRGTRDRRVPVRRLHAGAAPSGPRDDRVVVEEPLEVTVQGTDGRRSLLGVVLRTPGADLDLAVGWCVAEGLLSDPDRLAGARWCVRDPSSVRPGPLGATTAALGGVPPPPQLLNAVTVDVRGPTPVTRTPPRTRHAGCGVCGDDAIADLAARGVAPVATRHDWHVDVVLGLPDLLAAVQPTFARTGGLHAAARVRAGEVVAAAEDVGRHNAVDKLLGHALRTRDLDWGADALVLSGRAGQELVAKAAVAGAGLVVAVGAPTSLAVDLATAFGITLVAFARDGRGNAYSHPDRIHG